MIRNIPDVECDPYRPDPTVPWFVYRRSTKSISHNYQNTVLLVNITMNSDGYEELTFPDAVPPATPIRNGAFVSWAIVDTLDPLMLFEPLPSHDIFANFGFSYNTNQYRWIENTVSTGNKQKIIKRILKWFFGDFVFLSINPIMKTPYEYVSEMHVLIWHVSQFHQ